jgi:hypothetical protein
LASLKQVWRESLLFRRVTAGSVFVFAALLVYFGSHIPRSVSLPLDDLNARSTARASYEQIIIEKPDIAPGDLALSYAGSKNEVADLWLDQATLDDRSQHLLFPHATASAPGKISYTTDDVAAPPNGGDTCHTAIEIRRTKASAPVDSLTLFQSDQMAGAQRFRQVILDAGASTLDVEVHTDSPEGGPKGLSGCRKLLTVGGSKPVEMPPIPVHMLVNHGKIDLHFNPANPALSIFTGRAQTFEGVSLGDNTLRGSRLRIVATQGLTKPLLDVQPRSAHGITFGALKLGSNMLKLDIGRDAENAVAYANGQSIYNYDLIDAIQKNPILSFAFATVLVPALWQWVKKNCFPQ